MARKAGASASVKRAELGEGGAVGDVPLGRQVGAVGSATTVPGSAILRMRFLVTSARTSRAASTSAKLILAAISKRSLMPGPRSTLWDWMKGSSVD